MKNYFDLGASLYTPADSKHLPTVLANGLSGARSVIVCTEDAVHPKNLDVALENLSVALSQAPEHVSKVARFIRPRSPEILAQVLSMPGVEKIDGFVLPKINLETLEAYESVIRESGHTKKFLLMPTLETREVFDVADLVRIRNRMCDLRRTHPIVCIRIGANDILNLLGIKRMPGLTIYDTPVGQVIDHIVTVFRPYDFEISAPVFDYIDDRVTLSREVRKDLTYGFYAKTAIHPSQIDVIEMEFYQFLESNVEKANAVLNESDRAVFQEDGQMMEITCHGNWARRTIALAQSMDVSVKPTTARLKIT